MRIRVLAIAAALALGGCAPTHVLRDFTTDGCSLFPDGDADGPVCRAECCRQHDMAYWRGGTAVERRSADQAFRECVAQAGEPTLAGLMYRAVRLGGMPLAPNWFRWGYGWGYGRGYEPLTPAERQLAEDKLAAHHRANPRSACDSN